MHYSNHDNRLRRPDAAAHPAAQSFLSLERGARGIRLRVRTAATMARRKLAPFALPAAALVLAACATPVQTARAQLGYDPFAGNLSHSEERWATYGSAAVGGTNRPTSTAVNGVDATTVNDGAFNFAVSAPATNQAFVTSGGNIYSFADTLTLTLASNFTPTVGTFQTVIFSIKTQGTALDTAGILLTTSNNQTVSPRFLNVANSGSGMGAVAQNAFQFDLSGVGGTTTFTITVPGSGSSVSFSSSQLDATTIAYGAQNLVPEPSSVAFVAMALGGVTVAGFRCRRRS